MTWGGEAEKWGEGQSRGGSLAGGMQHIAGPSNMVGPSLCAPTAKIYLYV